MGLIVLQRFSAVLLVIALFILSTELARAHEWYPLECCSGRDCAPIPIAETPKEGNGGFWLIDGRHVIYKLLRSSPDERWHLCEQKYSKTASERKILCLYGPIGGT